MTHRAVVGANRGQGYTVVTSATSRLIVRGNRSEYPCAQRLAHDIEKRRPGSKIGMLKGRRSKLSRFISSAHTDVYTGEMRATVR